MPYVHLSSVEREEIAQMRYAGLGFSEIGRRWLSGLQAVFARSRAAVARTHTVVALPAAGVARAWRVDVLTMGHVGPGHPPHQLLMSHLCFCTISFDLLLRFDKNWVYLSGLAPEFTAFH